MSMPHPNTKYRHTDVNEDAAERGSDELRMAMHFEFRKLALRHGITVADASLLLMNGIDLTVPQRAYFIPHDGFARGSR